ncbi:hypothetical protein ANN_08492 [Periplaneta americana]|uniref:Uncharacterized protein n=1 Tax=Periplaneta americana TaxID=6978 RepID=A0ABQ8T1L6_PERAM|nr:hypothetical protein ANN_08492 [Periplaneta americana]
MVGLCEDGNEPPGSLKVSAGRYYLYREIRYVTREELRQVNRIFFFEYVKSVRISEVTIFNIIFEVDGIRELQNRAYNRFRFDRSENIRQGQAFDRMSEFQSVNPYVLQARQNTRLEMNNDRENETNSARKVENPYDNVVLHRVLDVKTGCECSDTRD